MQEAKHKKQNTRSKIQEAEHKKQNICISNIMTKMMQFYDYK